LTSIPAAVSLLTAAFLAYAVAAEDIAPAHGSLLERFALSAQTSKQWKLPDKLNEISGLALTEDGRLLAVTDERAIVYELDYMEGRLVKAFALGEPSVRGDFEGIAYSDGRVWLVTSAGKIYAAEEGEDGERVGYSEYKTGLSDSCEFEGLAYRPADRMLLLLCKKIKQKSGLKSLAIFAWSTSSRTIVAEEAIALPDRDIAAALRLNRLNPSGLAIDRQSGNLLIVAARQHAVVELDPEGTLLSARVLPLSARHPQAEGIEILPSGDLFIADEGGGHKARLAVYQPEVQQGANAR
jgi:uncharacterized protein YjiK